MKSLMNLAILGTFGIFLFSCDGPAETQDETAQEGADTVAAVSGTYALNNQESQLMWEGSMLKVGGVSLYAHEGLVNIQKGMINVEDGKVVGGTIVVDMTTITPTDENFNPEEGRSKDKLVGHLQSPDFFAVQEFPTATFEITGMQDNKIMGNMTIRGKTHPETIENVSMEMSENRIQAKGDMVIDRQKYDVAFKMPAEDKVLSDDLELSFSIVAMPEQQAAY